MNFTILAKSSGDEPYSVEFTVDGDRLLVFCNCQAGSFGKLCKHKTELLAGDVSRLYDESEEEKLDKLMSLVKRSPEISSLASEIAESEKVIRRKQVEVKKAKREFEKRMKEGFTLNR